MKLTVRLMCVAAGVGVLFGGSTTLASKDPECVRACQEQFKTDKDACMAAYKDGEDEIAQQRACCLDPVCWQSQWSTPLECLQDAQRQHIENIKDKNICFRTAQMAAQSCLHACPDESPIAP